LLEPAVPTAGAPAWPLLGAGVPSLEQAAKKPTALTAATKMDGEFKAKKGMYETTTMTDQS
jgi:hypothetical protein